MTKCSFLSGDSSCNTAGTMHRWYLFSFRQPLQKLGNLTDSIDCYTEQTLNINFQYFFFKMLLNVMTLQFFLFLYLISIHFCPLIKVDSSIHLYL